MAGVDKGLISEEAAPSARNERSERPALAPGAMICPVHDRVVGALCLHCGIRRVAVCAALDDAELRDLESIMSHRRLGPRQSLAIEGDEAEYAYNVISGGLKIYKALADGRAQMVGFLLPGDFLGLPRRGTYAFSAETLGSTELCQFPRAALTSVFEKHRALQERVLTVTHDELAAAQEHMLLLGRKQATERVCSFLVGLLRRLERSVGETDPLAIPLHRDEIAEYLGLTIETVSRCFTQLRNDGLIRLVKADLVSILDRNGLEALAGAN
jgi:CRP/FNR family transcriptional regulator, anaerobic regulatory protein